MADFDSLSLAEPEAPELSTQLDTGKPVDPGQNEHKEPAEEKEEAKKPESRLDAIKRAAEDVEKTAKPEEEAKEGDEKPEPKADPEEKVKDEPAPKPAAPKELTEAERQAKLAAMTPEQRRRYEINQTPPPEKLLPTAKEKWANVPGEVKVDFARIVKEHEAEVSGAREFIQPLVKYHQMAQQSGTSLPDALERYVGMEQALRNDPAQGFKQLLDNMEMDPTQAIGQILKAYGVNPQALAQHIAQSPEAYMPQQPRQQPQTPEDPRIAQLQTALQQQQAEHLRDTVIEPFKASHPRYNELERDIAFFLQSDRIPSSLGHRERLEVAYDMAARINPASNYEAPEPQQDLATPPSRAVAQDLGGNKSVRGAPSSGVDTSNRAKRKMSRGEAIEAAMADLGVT